MKKGPGFKPTPIESRTSGAPKPKIGIGEVTVTDAPKTKLDIGDVKVTNVPKPQVGIGEVTVQNAPKPPKAPSMVAHKANPDEKPGSSKTTYTAPPMLNPTVPMQGSTRQLAVPASLTTQNASRAPNTQQKFDPQSKAPITQRYEDHQGLPAPKQQSVGAPIVKKPPTMIAQKSVPGDLEDQHRKLTEKLRRRAKGGGKRAARRAQLAAFGKGLTFNGPSKSENEWMGQRADTFHGHYNTTPQKDGTHRVSYTMNKQGAKNRYGTSRGVKHADLGTHATHDRAVAAAVQHHKDTHQKLLGKAEPMNTLRVMTVSEYYDSMVKADAPTPGAPTGAPKRFPRNPGKPEKVKKATVAPSKIHPRLIARAPASASGKPRESASGKKLSNHAYAAQFDEGPTRTRMKPISDQDAMDNLKAGKHLKGNYEKSILIKLAAIKALTAGYNKVSGGGALQAANRGNLTVVDLQRAMEVMPKPKNVSKKPTVRLPGVHERDVELAAKPAKPPPIPKGRGGKNAVHQLKEDLAAKADSTFEKPDLKKKRTVVHKSEGAAPMAKTNFNDLFKSELAVANEEPLIDCPHCAEPITKSDIANQNAKGRTMVGGSGSGQVTSNRPGGAAQKTDAVVGVQNGKGSKARKSDAESDEGDMDKSDDAPVGRQQVAQEPKQLQKGVSLRGTDFVQYVDYGDQPGGDAYIAKSIAEAQGAIGQQATQPMDLNNDLSRLLV